MLAKLVSKSMTSTSYPRLFVETYFWSEVSLADTLAPTVTGASENWRRKWDSNPRDLFRGRGLANRCTGPLCDSSTRVFVF